MNFVNNIKNEYIRIKNQVNNNEIHIDGEIGNSLFTDGYTFDKFKADLTAIQGDVTINIKSYGGDLFEALAIHDYIRNIPNNVTTKIVGATASAGTIISFAGNTRLISANSRYLIHKPMIGAMGNSDDFRTVLDMLESLDKQLVDLYTKRSKLNEQDVLSLMIKEEFITAQKALEYGFVDAIIEENTQIKVTNQKTEKMEKVLKALNVDSEEKAMNAITDLQGLALKVQDLEVENTILNEEKEDKEKELEDLKAKVAKLEEELKEKEVENKEEEAEEIEKEVEDAVQNKKISEETKNDWMAVGEEKGLKHLRKLLNSIPNPVKADNFSRHSQKLVTGNPYNTKEELTAAFKNNKITAGEYQKQLKRFN